MMVRWNGKYSLCTDYYEDTFDPEEIEVFTCEHCGGYVDEGDTYCRSCGYALVWDYDDRGELI